SRWGIGLAWAALITGALATFALWIETERGARERMHLLLSQRVQVVQARLAERISTYSTALVGAARTLNAVGGGVSSATWEKMVFRAELTERAPGLDGFVYLVPERDSHPSDRPQQRLLVKLVDPAGGIGTLHPGGYLTVDATIEDVLRRALERGKPTLSRATWRLDSGAPRFLLVLPVARSVMTPVSAPMGTAGIAGYLAAVIDPASLIPGAVAHDQLDGAVEIYDGPAATPAALLFRTPQWGSAADAPLALVLPIDVEDNTWTVAVAPSALLQRAVVVNPAHAVLIAGLAVSLLLFFSLHWLASGQNRAALLALRMSDAAHARARRFSELARHAPVWVFIANPQGDFVFVNARWSEWSGLGEAAALGRGWIAALHPHDRDRVARDWNAAIGGASAFHEDFRMVAPDGRERYLTCSAVAERDEAGKIVAYIGTCVDITARREAELALRHANEALEARVSQRTAELEHANVELNREIDEHMRSEAALRRSNAQLQELVGELGLRTKARAALNEVGGVLGVCNTLEEGFDAVVRHIAAVFPQGSGCLYWFSHGSAQGRSVASWGRPATSARRLGIAECWALRRNQPHHLEGGPRGVPCEHLHHLPPSGSVCVPLLVRGELLALLYWEAPSREESSADKELAAEQEATWRNWAVSVGEYLALALANLTLRQTLEAQVRHDPLTDLYNRRYMQEALERELHRAERSQRPMGLIMMDLDHFKQYNDTFGHHAGDLLLVALAGCLRTQVRAADIVCRYGGEEFLVILPEASLELVLQRAEQLRTVVAEQMAELHGKERDGVAVPPVTMSLGVAVYPTHGGTVSELIRAADAALYRAKSAGRNRVEVAGESGERMPEAKA
ncbi:MAG TPA: diguanylate cyclase, partial [Burkholderiales bacterium]|nr:diguanylate cyclase [Burkholderiales bacterium]